MMPWVLEWIRQISVEIEKLLYASKDIGTRHGATATRRASLISADNVDSNSTMIHVSLASLANSHSEKRY